MRISSRISNILKLLFVVLFIVGMHTLSLYFIAPHNVLDYNKCVGPAQKYLIIGTSRASQAIQPKALQEKMNRSFFNFAFNGSLSKYGDVYNQAILKKLDPESKDGIFIVTVDPWSVSTKKGEESLYPLAHDQQNYLNQLSSFTGEVNLPFLYHNYNYGWMHLIWDYYKKGSLSITHEDGWLEIIRDTAQGRIDERKARKLAAKQSEIEQYEFSAYRWSCLRSLIMELRKKGKVYLVRLPISKEFYQLEQNHFDQFDRRIKSLTAEMKVPYWDMVNLQDSVKYNDGHHINRYFAPYISRHISEWIVNK